MKIPHVHRKTAKGKAYWYFATGQKKANGKPILKPLPAPSDPNFGRALADAKRGRTVRETRQAEVTVATLAAMFEKSREFRDKFAPSTQRSYRLYLGTLCEYLGAAPADEVTRAHATLLLDKLGDKPGAANQTIRTMSALYKWGRRRGHVTANPAKDIEYLEEGEHEPWPEWLLEEALNAEDALVRLATNLLFYTGQRIGDVLAMRWNSIKGGRIEVSQQKTDKPLAIRLNENLSAVLDQTPRRGFTIIAKDNGTPYAQTTVRKALQAFASERGVKVVPHGLRKNAVNGLLLAECSAAEVAAVTGQSLMMVEHYAKRRDQSRLGDSAILKLERKRAVKTDG
jgi:integrase